MFCHAWVFTLGLLLYYQILELEFLGNNPGMTIPKLWLQKVFYRFYSSEAQLVYLTVQLSGTLKVFHSIDPK